MAGIKISALPAATQANLSDVFPADQLPGPVTNKVSLSQVLTLFQQSNVNTLTGTQNEVLVNGTYGSPQTGALTLTLPQPIAVTNSPTFNNLTLTGGILSPVDGSLVVNFTSDPAAVNYLTLASSATTGSPVIVALGSDSNVNLRLRTRGDSGIVFETTAVSNYALSIYSGTYNGGLNTGQHLTHFSFANTLAIRTATFQDSNGTVAWLTDIPAGSPSALTKTDDNNVTLTLGGTPSTALLQATSLTLGWTGTLSGTRGGTGVNNGASTITLGGSLTTSGAFASTFTMTGITGVTFPTSGTLATTAQIPTGAALSKTDDTNVTLLLGGSPTTALVNAASLTLGWTGQLGLTRGGTAASLTASNGGIVYSTASALAVLAGTSTAGQMLQSGASTTPAWSTTTYPATNAINTIMYASSANVLGIITPVNSAVLISSAGGVPSWNTTLPSGIAATNMNLTTPTLGVASATSINFGGSTLSNYVTETSWTPAFTFITAGNLSVSYSTQTGYYTRIGSMIYYTFNLVFSPTFTTSSGSAAITGLPVNTNASFPTSLGCVTFSGGVVFTGSYINCSPVAGQAYLTLTQTTTSTNFSSLSTGAFPTLGTYTILGTGFYFV